MTTTLTNTVTETSVEVLQVMSYVANRPTRAQVRDVINTQAPDVILGTPGLRRGEVEVLCLTLADALAVDALHATPATFTLADTVLTGLDMTYALGDGEIRVEPDRQDPRKWSVRIPYQEVPS